MADLNKVMLIGRITSDLEVKKMGDSGVSVLNFTLVTNRSYKNKSWEKVEEAEFHRCVAFAGLSDMMWQYLGKWRKIFVEGRLRTRQWEDQSWNKRYTTEIVVTDMNFCDSKSGDTSMSNTSNKVEETTEEEDIPF
jgi:single-strand DNA-binding protein